MTESVAEAVFSTENCEEELLWASRTEGLTDSRE